MHRIITKPGVEFLCTEVRSLCLREQVRWTEECSGLVLPVQTRTHDHDRLMEGSHAPLPRGWDMHGSDPCLRSLRELQRSVQTWFPELFQKIGEGSSPGLSPGERSSVLLPGQDLSHGFHDGGMLKGSSLTILRRDRALPHPGADQECRHPWTDAAEIPDRIIAVHSVRVRSQGWRCLAEETTVLVERDQERRLVPLRTVPERVIDLREEFVGFVRRMVLRMHVIPRCTEEFEVSRFQVTVRGEIPVLRILQEFIPDLDPIEMIPRVLEEESRGRGLEIRPPIQTRILVQDLEQTLVRETPGELLDIVPCESV